MPEGQHALWLARLLLILHPYKAIFFWEGQTTALMEGLTLIRCSGHFDGTVLNWAGGPGGHGALLTGDPLLVVSYRNQVSYPNSVPLPASAIERIVQVVEPFEYGPYWDMVIEREGKAAVKHSAERNLHGGRANAGAGQAKGRHLPLTTQPFRLVPFLFPVPYC
jgi:hypothetical protein